MANTRRPQTPPEVARLKAEAPREPAPREPTRLHSIVFRSARGTPSPVPGLRTTLLSTAREAMTWRLDVELTAEAAVVGAEPLAERHELARPRRRRARRPDGLEPFRPGWAEFRPQPRVARPSSTNRVRRADEQLEPLKVFPPDGRKVYQDTSYPWRCVCQVETGAGTGSGVLIGKRHLLTASHVMDWNNLWVKATANRFDSTNQGVVFATHVVYYQKISQVTDSTVDEDYVVCILESPLGSSLGYLGYKTYDSAWDGEPYWWTMGYASDTGGFKRPVYEKDIVLDEDDWDFGAARALETENGDFVKGQSGSVVFGWWSGKPYAIGVCSAYSPSTDSNWMSGGSYLSDLISYARTHFP